MTRVCAVISATNTAANLSDRDPINRRYEKG
jgi:hypothetical protein